MLCLLWYIHTVIIMLAFLYQFRNGFSPFLVSVSSIYAHRCTKSSWLMTCVSFPVVARYTSSMTLKLVGKKMSKYPWWTCCGQRQASLTVWKHTKGVDTVTGRLM